jgi:succinylarginine dihydrolase
VGPTHNYSGLAPGNLASQKHAGKVANPRAAALQGLEKMAFLSALGVGQAVLPPQPRPDVATLRALGFRGTDTKVIEQAAKGDGHLLRACGSASSMWTANAASVAPSTDTTDGRLHLTVANLAAMFHRSLEARTTFAVLSSIFADTSRFAVHAPLPAGEHWSDEGAANHSRLFTDEGTVHLFAWGRSGFEGAGKGLHPRRQTREASAAVARLNALRDGLAMPWEQEALGVDAGSFHTDVLAVANEGFLMLHEYAFAHHRDLLSELKRRLGAGFQFIVAHETELPATDAVAAYPFNSQLVTQPDGSMAIIAPGESRDSETARRFLERVLSEDNRVTSLHFVDVNGSMNNGGGPAFLRLRVAMTEEETDAVQARVFLDQKLHGDLARWVERHYRDRMTAESLADPQLLVEVRTALDELTTLLRLGSVYDFQTP